MLKCWLLISVYYIYFISDQYGLDNYTLKGLPLGVNYTQQELVIGGKHSMYALANPRNSCHSWRDETTLANVMDIFYDPFDEEAKVHCISWLSRSRYLILMKKYFSAIPAGVRSPVGGGEWRPVQRRGESLLPARQEAAVVHTGQEDRPGPGSSHGRGVGQVLWFEVTRYCLRIIYVF